MLQLPEAEVFQAIGQIVVEFPVLECESCARAVLQWLAENQIEGKLLRLKTRRKREVFMTSDRYSLSESITENGTHYGVEVFGRVFDNLSAGGLARGVWLRDFHCPSEQFIVEELVSFENESSPGA